MLKIMPALKHYFATEANARTPLDGEIMATFEK